MAETPSVLNEFIGRTAPKSWAGRWAGFVSYSAKHLVRNRRLAGLTLLSVLVASALIGTLNAVGDGFLTISVLEPVAQSSVHLAIGNEAQYSPSLITENDLKQIRSIVESSPEVMSAEYVGTTVLPVDELPPPSEGVFVGFPNASSFYSQMTILSGDAELHANETYVDISSPHADRYAVGAIVPLEIGVWGNGSYQLITVNLTVAGFAQLSPTARNIALDNLSIYFGAPNERSYSLDLLPDIFVCSWEETLSPIREHYAATGRMCSIYGVVLAELDTQRLVNPGDLARSIAQLNSLESALANQLGAWDLGIRDYLREGLERMLPFTTHLVYVVATTALPAFALATLLSYAVGLFVVDRRRREFGLLLAKGTSGRSLIGLQLLETTLLSAGGALLGMLAGPLLAAALLGMLGYGPYGALQAAVWPVVAPAFLLSWIALSVPSVLAIRQVLRQPVGDVLVEMSHSGTDPKSGTSRLIWVLFTASCLVLGVWVAGVDIPDAVLELVSLIPISILGQAGAGIGIYGSVFLLLAGPVFILVGLVELGLVQSARLGRITHAIAGGLFGSSGAMAARSSGVHRRRLGLVVLVLALALSYTFCLTALLGSEQDFQRRQVAVNLGGEVRVELANLDNAPELLQAIRGMDGVAGATLIMIFPLNGHFLMAIEPDSWLDVAYYESDWFLGKTSAELLEQIRGRNDTAILGQETSSWLGLGVGDTLSLVTENETGQVTHRLRIVGLNTCRVGQFGDLTIVSWDFAWPIREGFVSTAWRAILVRLESSDRYGEVAARIRDLRHGVMAVRSAWEDLAAWQTMPLTRAPLDFDRIAIAFSLFLAGMGATVLMEFVIMAKLQEQRIMWARGVGVRRLRRLLFIEVGPLIALTCGLGLLVGVLGTQGLLTYLNLWALKGSPFVARHFILSPEVEIVIFGACLILAVSLLIPVVHRSRAACDPHQLFMRM